ncbi:MAG: protein-disulfide reductase DsbD family protein [Marinilabiliaceae bacterium]
MVRVLSFIFSFCAVAALASAQMVQPVHFSTSMRETGPATAEVVFSATIDDGWHVYSTNLGSDGPISASLLVNQLQGVELDGPLAPAGKEIKKFDSMFGMELRYFEGQVSFTQPIRFVAPDYLVDISLEYGACNDQNCLPPTTVDFHRSGHCDLNDAQPSSSDSTAEGTATAIRRPAKAAQADSLPSSWAPVTDKLREHSDALSATDAMPLWQILIEGLLGGLLAIFTPCVWPIIPLTVSFFLKRSKEKGRAVRDALTYGGAIVVIYVALGLIVTAIWGANQLNELATNAVFNIFFCALLLTFAASFFGAFEITLPSSWTDKVESRKGKASGLLAIFLMAFTLALVSFSCTGPIIGFLLVAVSTQGSVLAPAVGMLGFAIALAVPFTLFALFPSLLQKAPRSGGWMNAIKVTLGFVELAFALKFLSVADMAYGWRLLDREVFIALWVAIFGLLGAYHFGWLRFKSDDPDRSVGVGSFFVGLASLAFAIYMVPGLWGAPLKAVGAFLPPASTQDFRLGQKGFEADYTDYDAALRESAATGKPVLVDFTGFGCVNCRKMEATVFADPTVSGLLNDDFIVVSLFVDDKTPLAQPALVPDASGIRTLRTVGDKWSFLQAHKFGANTQPFYVVVDSLGNPLSPSRSYDEDAHAYADFLHSALR